MKRLVFFLALAAMILAPACVAPSPTPTPAATPAPDRPPPSVEDVDVRFESTQLPGCIYPGTVFEIFTTTTFRSSSQTSSLVFAWRELEDSPGVEVLNVGQNRKFTMLPTQEAKFTISVKLVSESGAQVGTLRLPVFRFDNLDGQGRACFSWATPLEQRIPLDLFEMEKT